MRRRDVLVAFLGLPAALAACRKTRRTPPPAGQLVFHRESLGHKLRDAQAIDTHAGQYLSTKVAIVGGGVAGLSAAWRLSRAGFDDYVLIEMDPVIGGTSRSGTSKIGAYPWGAHYVTVPLQENRAFVTLLNELGALDGVDDNGEPVGAESVLCRDPEERLYYRGYWHEGLYLHAGASVEDQRQRAAFEREVGRWVAFRDAKGRRAFAIPMATGSDDVEVTALDEISMATWMDRHGFTSPRLRWYVDYGCRDDYGLSAEDTSAWAGLFYYAARVREPGADYQSVLTWPEGNGRLVAHLHDAVKARVRLGWAAAELRPSDTGVDIACFVDGGSAAAFVSAQQVVFAAPHFLARHLIRDWKSSPPAHVAEFQYSAWMVANLTLRDRLGGRGFAPSWDNVLYDSPSLGYVVSTHQSGLDHGPTVITYYYPVTDRDPRAARQRLLEADWRDWSEVAFADLERAHRDIREQTERIDIARWGHAMIRPTPGFVWGDARRRAGEPYRNIYFAHSDLSGVALFEEAFYRGIRAAEDVLTAREIPFETML